jgi:hypothetical protein
LQVDIWFYVVLSGIYIVMIALICLLRKQLCNKNKGYENG